MSANLLTLYIFYEMMSLSTLPLVMHGGSGVPVHFSRPQSTCTTRWAARPLPSSAWYTWSTFGGTTDFRVWRPVHPVGMCR